MMAAIILMLVEIPNFFRRMKYFYYLYKERRGIQLFNYINSLSPKKQVDPKKNVILNKLNKNVFTNVCSFLDVKSLGNVAQANKRFKDLAGFAPIWKEQYEKY